MQAALVPLPDNGAGSWTQRPALGETGNLGQLYNVRKDEVLGSSIFKIKSQLLPDKSVQPTTYSSHTYEATVTDSLEEKFSKLQVSVDFRASLLCGMLQGCWGVDYCLSQNTDARTVQASVICKTKKRSEDLLLANDELRDYLDLEALHTADATHVICGLEWGAQTIVTAEIATTTVDQAQIIRGGIGNGGTEVKDKAEEDVRVAKQGIMGRVLDTIGKAHASGKVDWDSKCKKTVSSFKFKIISDIGDPGIPRDVDDVLRFLETSKSEINNLNDGKGVPIAFHLRPIDDIAKRFSITLQHSTTVQRLDEEYIDGFVKLLEKRRAITLELEEYEAFLKEHSFCVPATQIEKAGEQLDDAREVEDRLRMSLKQAVESIRGGRAKMDKLRVALKRGSSKANTPSEYPSILREYVDKIHFANTIKDQGAMYIRNDAAERDMAIIISDTPDVYVLYFDEASRHHPDWNENRQKLMELLCDKDGGYSVVVVDCDLSNPGQLEKPHIEQCRDGKAIIADVVGDCRELDGMCCVKCSDQSKVDRSRSAKPPPASRIMRVPCPIKRCHTSGKYRWTCPDCRQQVFYGFTDEYLYCQCARYPYSLAVFKCRNHDAHGKDYVKYDDADLLKLLKALDSQEKYNILILGETGVGKSMFLNAFHNYLIHESLEEAMADPRELQYSIPFAFSWKEKVGGQVDKREVVVGEATKSETLSRAAESGTTKPIIYTFPVDNKVIMFIDTPGIGDTRGITQDEKNMRSILRTLERGGVHKLSAVLILLKPNMTRLTPAFEFCLTEFLRHLHLDIIKNNMLFGFTNASGTRYNLGTTEGLLNEVFRKLKTDIALGDKNQFFFDSEGFMFLADYKLHGRQMQSRSSFDEMWTHSADEAHRLLSTVMDLDVHNVRRTIDMNRIRRVLDGMAPPLTEFTTHMKQSQTDVENGKQKLEALDLESENAAEELKNFKISITVPVRYKLPSRRLVCGHASCCKEHISEDDSNEEYKTYQKSCHENCDLTAPDMVPGANDLWWCYAFRSGFVRGYPCYVCKHEYTDHLLVSSVYVRETKLVENRKVLGELKSLEEKKQAALRLIAIAEDSLNGMRQEETQIKETMAQIAVYLEHNVITHYNDAAVAYIDYNISRAKEIGESDKVIQLEQQKTQHKGLVTKINTDIDSGVGTLLTEEGINRLIEGLKSMKIFGKYLVEALEQDTMAEDANDDEEFRPVAIPSRSEDNRKIWNPFRFKWPF
jgi:hypothetical protein